MPGVLWLSEKGCLSLWHGGQAAVDTTRTARPGITVAQPPPTTPDFFGFSSDVVAVKRSGPSAEPSLGSRQAFAAKACGIMRLANGGEAWSLQEIAGEGRIFFNIGGANERDG